MEQSLAGWAIAVVDADGTGFRRVLSNLQFARLPAWQPLRPAPTLAAATPSVVTAGGGGFALSVTGTGFLPGSRVRWNGADRPTTRVDATRLVAQIPASDVAVPGTGRVSVVTPAPGGGTSAEAQVQVAPAAPPAGVGGTPPGGGGPAGGPAAGGAGDLGIARAAATGRWREGRLRGSVSLRITVTRAATLDAAVRSGSGRILARRRIAVRAGTAALALPLPPATLPGPLQVTVSDASPPAGAAPLPTRVAAAALAPPPQGVADRAFITTAPQGAPLARARYGVRVLYATFRFASPPARGRRLTVVWTLGGFRTTFRPTRPASRTVVQQIGSLGAGRLARGRWTATLRAGGVVVARARIRVG